MGRKKSITGTSEFCFSKSIQGQGKKTAVKKAGLVGTLYDLKQLNEHWIAVTGKQTIWRWREGRAYKQPGTGKQRLGN